MSTIAENLTKLQTIKTNIKTAINNKGGNATDDFTKYAEEINNLPTSTTITLTDLTVTENGTYNPTENNAYSSVTVNVQGGEEPSPTPEMDKPTGYTISIQYLEIDQKTKVINDYGRNGTTNLSSTTYTEMYIDGVKQSTNSMSAQTNTNGYHQVDIKYKSLLPTSGLMFSNPLYYVTKVKFPDVDITANWQYGNSTIITGSGLNSTNSGLFYFMVSTFGNFLNEIDFSNQTFKAAKKTPYMFYGLTNLTKLNIQDATFDETLSTYNMFGNCINLTSITFNTGCTFSKVQLAYYMFASCSSLKTIDTSHFAMTEVSAATCMFSGCTSLTGEIDLSNCDFSNITSSANTMNIFYSCNSVSEIKMPKNYNIIGNGFASYCYSLTSITFNQMTAPTIQSTSTTIFVNVPSKGKLKVPQGSTGWGNLIGTTVSGGNKLPRGWTIEYY